MQRGGPATMSTTHSIGVTSHPRYNRKKNNSNSNERRNDYNSHDQLYPPQTLTVSQGSRTTAQMQGLNVPRNRLTSLNSTKVHQASNASKQNTFKQQVMGFQNMPNTANRPKSSAAYKTSLRRGNVRSNNQINFNNYGSSSHISRTNMTAHSSSVRNFN